MANRNEATERDDILIGGSGHDTIGGRGGDDIIEGGSYADVLEGDGGSDTVLGGSGDDLVKGGSARDTLSGGSGDDVIDAGDSNDILRGGAGDDLMLGDWGHDHLWGDEGNDTLRGSYGNDILIGGSGDDILIGGEGADIYVYRADAGDDVIYDFEVDKDVIDLRQLTGTIAFADLKIVDTDDGDGVRITHDAHDGSIQLRGVAQSDLSAANFVLPGGAAPFIHRMEPSIRLGDTGDDRIAGTAGRDAVLGGEGDDRIEGLGGDDDVFGEEGDDTMDGGDGRDRLFGGEGDDVLDGGSGNDFLHGGEGDDTLTGGAGADVFAIGAACGLDTVTDFTDGEDRIDLSSLEGIAGFDDLRIARYADTTVIDLTSHGCGTIRLENTAADGLDATDFVFYEPAADTAANIEGM